MELAFLLDHCECISHFFFPMLYHATQKANDPLLSPVAKLRIPDTVLYTYSKPTAWYTFDEEQGGIRRRSKQFLNSACILESFLRHGTSRTGIKAWFATPTEDLSTFSKVSHDKQTGHQGKSHHGHKNLATAGFIKETDLTATLHVPEIPVRIVSQSKTGKDGLLRFLQLPKGKGVLQLYVDNQPESDGTMRNVVAVCTYSHITFTVERLSSRHKLCDGHIPLENRFDLQSNMYDRRAVMTPASARQYLEACENVAKCITFSLGYVVAGLSLCCRVDAKDRLHILWCNGLKLHQSSIHPGLLFHVNHFGTQASKYGEKRRNSDGDGDDAQSTASSDVHVTQRSQLNQKYSKAKAALSEITECRVCHDKHQRGLMPRVQLKWLLFALSLLDSSVDGWEDNIPPSVAMVCPEMTSEEFHRVKDEAEWKSDFVRICDTCLLRANEANEKLSKNQHRVPTWLHIDEHCRRGAAGSAFRTKGGPLPASQRLLESSAMSMSRSQGRMSPLAGPQFTVSQLPKKSPNPSFKLGAKRSDLHASHGAQERHMQHSTGGPLKKADVLKTLFGIRRNKLLEQADGDNDDDDQEDSLSPTEGRKKLKKIVHPRFAAATKDHPLGAPLYATDARGVWRPVGFGRPASPTRDLAPVPLSVDSRRILIEIPPAAPSVTDDDDVGSNADASTSTTSAEPEASLIAKPGSDPSVVLRLNALERLEAMSDEQRLWALPSRSMQFEYPDEDDDGFYPPAQTPFEASGVASA